MLVCQDEGITEEIDAENLDTGSDADKSSDQSDQPSRQTESASEQKSSKLQQFKQLHQAMVNLKKLYVKELSQEKKIVRGHKGTEHAKAMTLVIPEKMDKLKSVPLKVTKLESTKSISDTTSSPESIRKAIENCPLHQSS